jgi:hypothetical protein
MAGAAQTMYTSGAVHVWLLNGTSIIGSGSPGSTGLDWTIQSVGDFNGDGMGDILWGHTSGTVHIWFLNGANTAGSGTPGSMSSAWSIED